jgi:60 kDa SS-A/Ro ribonucleoprotein
MATLNKTKTRSRNARMAEEVVQNYHDIAYKMKPIEKLIERTLGAFWSEDTFYAKGSKMASDTVADIKTVLQIDPKFVLQLAAFARNEMYLRTTPQVLLVQAANFDAAKPFIKEYTPKIVKRADELADVIAYQLTEFGKPIPNSLKKGLAAAFANFDEYQLNKYDSNKSTVSLGDVLKLIYRKEGYPVTKALYNYLVNDEVDAEALPKIGALKALLSKDTLDSEAKQLARKSGATWETLLSKFGSNKEVWETAIPNMGYMALLRNLRNFETAGVDLLPVLEKIGDPERVRKSKQLPFRFYSAYKNTSNSLTQRAISRALEASLSNVELPGRTGVIVDLSGSMRSTLSDKSNVQYVEVGALLGAIAAKKAADSIIVGFATTAQVVRVNPDDTIMTNMQKIMSLNIGGSTNAHLGFAEIAKEKLDRIILISDMQCYGGSHGWTSGVADQWKKYVSSNPKSRLYSLDLHGYGTKQVPSETNGAYQINGWTDKVFDFITLAEKKDVMAGQIRKW